MPKKPSKRSSDSSSQSRLARAEEEIAKLRKDLNAWTSDTAILSVIQQFKAELLAMNSIVGEILGRVGMTFEEFKNHLAVRTAHYRDILLSDGETRNPALAAALDDREPGSIPTEKGFPPLFEP